MKKIYLLINDRVAGPYDIEILTKMQLEKEFKIKFENDKEWVFIEDFLHNTDNFKMLEKEETKKIDLNNIKNLVRIKEKKVKHTRHSFLWLIHKFTARYNINTIYITILFISFAIVIFILYLRYHLYLRDLLFY